MMRESKTFFKGYKKAVMQEYFPVTILQIELKKTHMNSNIHVFLLAS